MNILKPKKLKKGDTISIIAPAGCVDMEKIYQSKTYFEKLGYCVKLGKNIFKQKHYLAGTDEERLEDLHSAFSDSSVDAIFCARGGYGSLRLINNIDYEIIKNNPKIFCGYSDITILSLMFYKKTKLITYSAPMPQGDFAGLELCEYTLDNFFSTLSNGMTTIFPQEIKVFGNIGNNYSAILWGGNLTSVASVCTENIIPDENFIFFAEDINEPVYKIDRYFTQIFNIDKFAQNVKAVILGDFIGIEDENLFSELFESISKKYSIPVIGGYPFGHGTKKVTLPIGADVQLVDNKIIVNNFTAE